jgi:hypothetical protein
MTQSALLRLAAKADRNREAAIETSSSGRIRIAKIGDRGQPAWRTKTAVPGPVAAAISLTIPREHLRPAERVAGRN